MSDDEYEYDYNLNNENDDPDDENENEDDEDLDDDDDEYYITYYRINNENQTNEETNDTRFEENGYEDNNYADYENTHNINDNAINNLDEILNIHTSNERIFNTIGSNVYAYNPQHNNASVMTCPICSERLHISQITTHVLYQHTGIYLSINMLTNPSLSIIDVQNMVNVLNNNQYSYSIGTNTYNTIHNLMFSEDDDINTASYEDLLNLCDYMGYHKPGIKELDLAAPIVEENEMSTIVCDEDTCRICLEGLHDTQPLRKIKICNHIFCSECITEWFKENKTCPLCNIDASPVDRKGTQTDEPINVTSLDTID